MAGGIKPHAKSAIPAAREIAAEVRYSEFTIHFRVTAPLHVEFQAIALLRYQIDRQGTIF